jgi:endonuclease/exonuclease/phosphatase family metal-dependent hydrolase
MTRISRSTALALALAAALAAGCPAPQSTTPPSSPSGDATYLFCFWNVENLFDDVDDHLRGRGDKDYDGWLARDKAMRDLKYANLCKVLLGQALSGGRGPDILAIAEAESQRSVELLRNALNARLDDPQLHYNAILWKEHTGGRHIGTAILTRLPVVADRTQLLSHNLRILEGRVKVAGQELVIIAAHWASRISDKVGEGRAKYGDQIYGRFLAMYKRNPKVDVLVCGDFNDNPDDPSVTEHLRATGDEAAVRANTAQPRLLNLFARPWKEGVASHFYGAKAYLFDQICVSPGMLDPEGWSVVPGSARVVPEIAYEVKRGPNKGQLRPDRFGGPKDKRDPSARGASDHFPVVVRLSVR